MAQFNIVTTDAGAALLAGIVAGGHSLVFTHQQSGSGLLTGGMTAQTQTALVTPQQMEPISSLTVLGDAVTVASVFDNTGLGAGYTWTEIGLWAQDTVGGGADILFAYGNTAGDSDYMPAGSSGTVVTVTHDAALTISAAVPITATVDDSGVYVTMSQVDTEIAAKVPVWHVDTLTFTSTAGPLALSHAAVAGSALMVNIVGVTGGGSFAGDSVMFGVEGAALSFDSGGLLVTVSGANVSLNAADGTVELQVMYQYIA